jgi:CubicO group peptidase (beta-lactamase class C family)
MDMNKGAPAPLQMRNWRVLAASLLLAGIAISCAPDPNLPIVEETADGWRTGSLESVGLDPAPILEAIERVEDGTYQNVHSIVIVKDDKLVFEDYFSGHRWSYSADQHKGELVDFDRDTIHNLASVTKSFTSALVGIAIDQGLISGVNDPVFDYFQEYADLAIGEKEGLTLEHLLTMTSGFEWNEMQVPYSNRTNDLVMLFNQLDPVAYILEKPLVTEPGEDWYYNGGNTNLLGETIREVSGLRMDYFAEEFLFDPLGITEFQWDYITPSVVHASGNLQLRPRDLAKFGTLFLNGGIWKGERIISEDWVRESTKPRVSVSSNVGYGYQWWQSTYLSGGNSYESYQASGWGGQEIIVFPGLDMVVVFTGGNYVGADVNAEILTKFILAAVD